MFDFYIYIADFRLRVIIFYYAKYCKITIHYMNDWNVILGYINFLRTVVSTLPLVNL